MIRVNLMPGSAKRATRKMPKIPLGPFGRVKGLPSMDRTRVITAGCWILGLGLTAYMFLGGRARKAELTLEIEAARADSVRLHALIQSKARLDSTIALIGSRLSIVQQIDANRYVWAHILDEVSRALPEHTWLTNVDDIPADSAQAFPKFVIEGRTGNNFALTKYLEQLEISPFIRGVKLRSSALVQEENRYLYSFHVEASYEQPPVDMIETRPLFVMADDSAAAEPAPPAEPTTQPRAQATARTGGEN